MWRKGWSGRSNCSRRPIDWKRARKRSKLRPRRRGGVFFIAFLLLSFGLAVCVCASFGLHFPISRRSPASWWFMLFLATSFVLPFPFTSLFRRSGCFRFDKNGRFAWLRLDRPGRILAIKSKLICAPCPTLLRQHFAPEKKTRQMKESMPSQCCVPQPAGFGSSKYLHFCLVSLFVTARFLTT